MTPILVNHSDPEICQLLYQELTAAGYVVDITEEKPTAVDFDKIVQPTLLISEWNSQDSSWNSSEWQALKANPAGPFIFHIGLTPPGASAQYATALNCGVDDVLTTPINHEELQARVWAGIRVLKLRQELWEQRQLLETELSEAEAYVRSLLPDDLTEKIPITARFIPSRLLGGDCYDYYWLDPDYLAIYLLDVSGHGLGSALLSTSVLNVLRSQSLPNVNFYRPEKVLDALNETFQMNDQNEKYFTIWYGVYNRAKRQLLYASAGHPPAVLVTTHVNQPQTIEPLKTSGLPVGMLPDTKYQWQRCHIPASSRLYLFSDGIYEIQQSDNSIMGLDDFINILAQHTADKDIDEILHQVSARTTSRTFSDDLSLLEVSLE
ncbi:MAG: SpoIIE family protein phosphatase [Cyanobacteria bacterium P01_H01_bin.58]